MKKPLLVAIISVTYIFSMAFLAKRFVADVYYKEPKSVVLNKYEPTYYRYRAKQRLLEGDKVGALSDVEKAVAVNPKNLTTLRNIIPIYYFLNVSETQEYFNYLKITYPNDLGILADIAEYEQKLNHMEDFRQTVQQAKSLRPDIVEWHKSFMVK